MPTPHVHATYMRMHACARICSCGYTCVHAFVHEDTRVHAVVHVERTCVHAFAHEDTRVCMHVFTRAYVRA